MAEANEQDSAARYDNAVKQLYETLGCPYGDTADGYARFLAERLAAANQDRRNPHRKGVWGGPINDPRIRRGS